MIKILAKGVPPKDKVYRGKCSCGRHIEATAEDLNLEKSGNNEQELRLDCGTCGKKIVFSEYDPDDGYDYREGNRG